MRRGHTQQPPTSAALLVVLAAAALPLQAAEKPATAPAVRLDTTVHPEQWAASRWPFAPDPELEARVKALLAGMSVEDKVGQIVQGDIGSITPDDVRRYRLGSVLAGGNSDPINGKYGTPQEWLKLADAFYEASVAPRDGQPGIPVIFGIDAVHGHNNAIGTTLFPHNVGLGAVRDPELMRRIAAATAIELRVTGAEWTFAPVLTVPRDDRWGRAYEGYSEDPALVASYAAAVVEGLQGKVGSPDFLDGRRVLASAKHFLADGGTEGGKDQGDARISETELREVHGAGYPFAIAAGVQTIMASFSGWNGVKMHGNGDLLTRVLKERMGFGGFVVGDWNAHGQVPGCTNEDCAASFNAGVDMLMAPDSWKGYYESALRHVRDGTIPMRRLDDAVARILRVKLRLGLFEAGKPSQRAVGGKFELLGSAAHRALAREAARRSLVLLKNDGGVLPLDPKRSFLVAGSGADNLTQQTGGWTLSWQGSGTARSDFPGATSIWEGLRDAVKAAGGSAQLAVDGKYARKPEFAIVVFGEDPYAEFVGDLRNLHYRGGQGADLALLKRLKADGIKVVTVFLSGRPLWVNREINASDAFVAAWLPGSEGAAIADVLLRDAKGAVAHDFSGKLAFSWPANAAGAPLNHGQAGYAPQFAFGYGLRYGQDGGVGILPEDPGVAAVSDQAGVYFDGGVIAAQARFSLRGADGSETDATTLPARARDGSITLAALDNKAQEDARRVEWKQAGAQLRLALSAPTDLSRETNGDVMLVLSLSPLSPAGTDAALGLAVQCGEGCSGRVALDEVLRGARGWTTVGIPLKCLRAAGARTETITAPLVLDSSKVQAIGIARIALGTEAERRVSCSP